jgi:hypothetical protein
MQTGYVVTALLALFTSGTSRAMGPSADQPTAPPAPRADACTGPILEYCNGKCPTYAESLARVRQYCKGRPERVRIVVEHCVGVYHSISVRTVAKSDEYFDASGKLVAALSSSDEMGSFCNGASSTKTYGKIPTCSTEFVTVDFCKQ